MNIPTRSLSDEAFDWVQGEGHCEVPPDQGSPYIRIFWPELSEYMPSRAERMLFMVVTSCSAIRSKRKPSMWYSSAQYLHESIMYLRNIALSEAVSFPQPEPLEYAVLDVILK